MKWNWKKPKKEHHSIQKANHNILLLTYLVVLAFVGLIVYFSYFLQVKSENVINNTYNARLDSFATRIVRGKILSNDGTILAETLVGEDGEERRNYPFGSLFAHVVGYSTKGKTGLETLGNFYMLTSHVNLVEQVVNELSSKKNLGDHVVTTLDVGL
ncbi:MAG: penicillin-binding protein 2, partial [Hungatella sp.]